MEKQNTLDLATKADIIRRVQAGEPMSATFLAAFLSAIMRIKPDAKAKAARHVHSPDVTVRVMWKAALLRVSRRSVFSYGSECIESEFRGLSAFPCAIPDDTTAHEFVSADDDVEAVADTTMPKKRTL